MDGHDVRLIRRRLDLTHEQLARELGVTVSSANHWENGRRMSRLASAAVERFVASHGLDDPGDDGVAG